MDRIDNIKKLRESDSWRCTDPDTNQFVRHLGGHSYEVYEGDVDEHSTHHVGDMTINQIEDAIDGYYDSFGYLLTHYDLTPQGSVPWSQVVAECLSEKQAPART